jgi:hypothetical protein
VRKKEEREEKGAIIIIVVRPERASSFSPQSRASFGTNSMRPRAGTERALDVPRSWKGTESEPFTRCCLERRNGKSDYFFRRKIEVFSCFSAHSLNLDRRTLLLAFFVLSIVLPTRPFPGLFAKLSLARKRPGPRSPPGIQGLERRSGIAAEEKRRF